MLNFRGFFKKVRSRGSTSNASVSSRNSTSENELQPKEITPLSYFQEDESTRAWGDELSGDLLYTIILRRVRYSKNSDEGLQWETQKVRLLKAGSLERLVDHLAAAFLHDDVNFLSIFLSTYRTFLNPLEALDMLILRFENLSNEETAKTLSNSDSKEAYSKSDCEAIKASILRVLELWIERHPEDWQQPPKYILVQRTLQFCNKYKAETEDVERKTRKTIHDARRKQNKNVTPLSLLPTKETDLDRTSVNKDAALFFLRHMSESDIAKSLLAYDVRLFRRVIPWQCLGSVWSRRGTGAEISTVKATVKQFNHVVYIVLATVLSPCLSLAQRAKIVEKWIKVAEESRTFKNFSSLRAILSGLQTHAVYRLKKTWEVVPENVKKNFEKLHEEMKSELKSDHESSSVPYLGTFLHDLMMLDTAHTDLLKGLINFEKRRKEFELLTMISLLQMGCEKHEKQQPSQDFEQFISLIQPLTDEQGFELSQMAEGGDKTLDQEPVKWGSLLQHSFSTLMDDSDSDTISEPKVASSALLDLKSPRISTFSFNNASAATSGLASPNSGARPSSSSSQPNNNHATARAAAARTYVIVRITVDDPMIDLNGVNYRCIRVSEHDRVKSVLVHGLAKHNLLHERPSCWNLIQKLKNRELPLPDSTNVFHAMDKSLGDGQLEFVLRRKTHHELHEAEKLQRQKKSKLYGTQTATVSGMTIPPSLLSPAPGKAQVQVERKESVAQKIGSVSMANLGKDESTKNGGSASIKSKSLSTMTSINRSNT
ncbi:unnamed protein product [Oikopleura dioica]|uniref:Ras-GEF domain-containing protein n=1 Tax=Oikopleura dioica TaxID=34765 RepID=E4Y5Q8_OIKDI|nr:unnamed protein product [Oikopleura dioica]